MNDEIKNIPVIIASGKHHKEAKSRGIKVSSHQTKKQKQKQTPQGKNNYSEGAWQTSP